MPTHRRWENPGIAGRATTTTLAACAALLLILAALPAAAAAGRVRGIDVSRFQGTIGWERVGQTKIEFVFAQASRGSGGDCTVAPESCGADAFYGANLEGARANGMLVGPYHRAFAAGGTRARAKADARTEAGLFIKAVNAAGGFDLRPVLDVETPFKRLDAERLKLWIRVWLQKVERRLGVKPMIYTNASSWSATGDTQRFARRGHKLWVANFNVPNPAVPAADWAGKGWSIWQFTSTGSVRGVAGNVDKNKLGVPIGRIKAR